MYKELSQIPLRSTPQKRKDGTPLLLLRMDLLRELPLLLQFNIQLRLQSLNGTEQHVLPFLPITPRHSAYTMLGL